MGAYSQRLPEHESFVHGLLSLHWESSQHSAQPTPAQHSDFLGSAHSAAVCSHSEVAVVQVSSLQASPSSQSASPAQASLRRQSAVAEQSSGPSQATLGPLPPEATVPDPPPPAAPLC